MSGRSETGTSVSQKPESSANPRTAQLLITVCIITTNSKASGMELDLPFSLSESPSGSCRVRQRWLSAGPHGRFKDDPHGWSSKWQPVLWKGLWPCLLATARIASNLSLALPHPLFLTLLTYSYMLQTEASEFPPKAGSQERTLSSAHAKNLKTRGH